MIKLFLLAAGGAFGTLLRYLVSGLAYRLWGETFPWGTLAVNLLGCFLIGLLWGLAERAPFSPKVSIFLFTGTLGAFTTFSTYGLESINLLRDGEVVLGLANIVGSNLAGLTCVMLGFILARYLPQFIHLGGAS